MISHVNSFVNIPRAVKLKIYGRVQGVFYRTKTREKALELGLTGFARNESDGTVFILVEGPRQTLEKFIKWCYAGPRGARVEKIDIVWGEAGGEYNEFKIEY